jgi:transposase
MLLAAKRSARSERTATINQIRALVATAPEDLRARFAGHSTAALVAEPPRYAPRPGDVVGYATRFSLRQLGRRAAWLHDQIGRLDTLLNPLVAERAPSLLALYGVGPDTAAILLVAAGDHPDRLRSEAGWAHLCGTAPIPASSGKITRWRLDPAGDRQGQPCVVADRADPDELASRAPAPTWNVCGAEGLSKPEIIRCLTRYVAREVYRHLRPRHSD